MSTHTQRKEVTKGLRLIAQGVPLRTAAERVGVAPSSLTRARKLAGAEPLPLGRPAK